MVFFYNVGGYFFRLKLILLVGNTEKLDYYLKRKCETNAYFCTMYGHNCNHAWYDQVPFKLSQDLTT